MKWLSKKEESLEALRHSIAHLLAAAVLELYPDAKRAIGPAIEHGFYYDFDFSECKQKQDKSTNFLKPEDLEKIEKE